jgi:hypothetical protein
MLEKEWLCSLSKMVSWSQYVPLIISYSKGGKHATITRQHQMCLEGEQTQIGCFNCLKKKSMNPSKILKQWLLLLTPNPLK